MFVIHDSGHPVRATQQWQLQTRDQTAQSQEALYPALTAQYTANLPNSAAFQQV